MQLEQLLDVLALLKVNTENVHVYKDSQIQISCPLAPWLHTKRTDESPSMSLKFGVGQPTLFKCFACHEGGKLWQLVDSYGQLSKDRSLIELAERLLVDDVPTLQAQLATACKGLHEWFKSTGRRHRLVIHSEAMRRFCSVRGLPEVEEYLLKRDILS